MTTNSGLSKQELMETRKALNRKIKALKRYSSDQSIKDEISAIENTLENIRCELCLRSFSIAEEMGAVR